MTFLRRQRDAIIVPLVLAGTTAAFAWKLIFTGLVVIGYDTMTYMYPYRVFAAQALREGRVPLWNPWVYFGVPFLANLQSAVFYPLHALFLILPGPFAMNASVVLHFFLAAWFAALAARGIIRLDWWSAGVAGLLYGFSGFVGTQVGHLNQLNAAAWLPLAMLTMHRALDAHAIRWAVATGLILAVQLLAGHAQESYMTVVALAAYVAFDVVVVAWTLSLPGRAPHGNRVAAWARSLADSASSVTPRLTDWRFRDGAALRWRAWWRHAIWSAVLLGLGGTFAGGIAAVQALPTTELTAVSIRSGGMSFGEAISFSLPPRELFVGLLPTFGLASPSSNEFLGWVGFSGATLVLAGITFRARQPAVLFFAILALVALLLALGNHTPIYGSIFRLPGMNLFRVPARWLLLATFGASMVGGAGLNFLRAPSPTPSAYPVPPRPWFRLVAASRLMLAVAVVTGAATIVWPFQHVRVEPAAEQLAPIWMALAATSLLLAFGALAAAPSRLATATMALAVAAELGAASSSLEYNNPNPPGVYLDSRPPIDALRDALPPGRTLAVAMTGYQPFDAPLIQGNHGNILGLRGVGAGLVNTKHKDTLNPNLPMVFGIPVVDGYDGGVLPFRRYVDFKSLIVPPERNQPDGLLRDQLGRDQTPYLPPPDRLRQWGVTYVLRDTIGDHLVDGAYLDFDSSIDLAPGTNVRLPAPILAVPALLQRPDMPVNTAPTGATLDTTVSSPTPRLADLREVAIAAVRPEPNPSGFTSMVVTLADTSGREAWAGRLGVAPFGPSSSDAGATATRLPNDTTSPGTFVMRLPVAVASNAHLASISVRAEYFGPGMSNPNAARATLRAITLVGGDQSWPIALAHGGAIPLVHRSDVKIYRLTSPPPRVRLATRAIVVDSDAAALAALRDGPPDDTTVVLQEAPPVVPDTSVRGRMRAMMARVWRALGRDDTAGYLTAGTSLDLPRATGGTVAIEDERPEGLRLRVSTPASAIVVVRDTFFAGWQATVDGDAAPVWRADLLFRGVPVSAGDHVVELTYRQATYEVGRMISLASIALALSLLVIPQTSARHRAWPPTASPIRHTQSVASASVDEATSPTGQLPALSSSDASTAGHPFEAGVTAAFDREREGDYLEDGSTLGGLYIASHEADPEVARESAARPLPQPSRADAPTTNRPSSDDGQ
jgi:hypothetical protein